MPSNKAEIERLYIGGDELIIKYCKRFVVVKSSKSRGAWQIPLKEGEKRPTKSQILRILQYSKW